MLNNNFTYKILANQTTLQFDQGKLKGLMETICDHYTCSSLLQKCWVRFSYNSPFWWDPSPDPYLVGMLCAPGCPLPLLVSLCSPSSFLFCSCHLIRWIILCQNADAHPSHQSTYTFSYNEMRSATSSFHPTNKIGYGGFGTVYKGILSDGTQVAIKSLSIESKQGIREFLTEIEMLSNVRHPNLVRLIGCCVEGANRMLVYDYMENNSLARALLGPYNKQIALNWPERAAICLGAANGLAFLHEEVEPNIVHRDIKASNVLLDKNLRPKIGDFGLAKLFPDTVTHVSTRVAGTMGYLAPEYALLGKLTKKADIYSFGVLMLEIISGRSCARSVWGLDMKALLEWTWKLRGENRLLDIVDPELAVYPKNEALHFIKTALFCTQAAAHQRPNMKRVVEMLQSSDEVELFVGALKQPGVLRASDRSFGIVGNKPAGSKHPRYSESKTTYGFISTAEDTSSAPVSTFEMQPR